MSFKLELFNPRRARRARALRWTRMPLLFVLLLLGLAASSAQAQTRKLESGWQFLTDPKATLKAGDVGQAAGWRDVRVGLSWNAQFEDLRDYMGAAWYRTSFPSPALTAGQRLILRFGAVDYFTEVFVNGQRVGEHEGGYTPFQFEITGALRAGTNEILVRVIDPPMDERENRALFPEMMYNEIPHGKQNWYVQTGGIWQPVTLETKPRDYITRLQVISKTDGSLQVYVHSNAHLGPPPPAPGPARRPVSFIKEGEPGTGAQTILDQISVRVTSPTGQSYQLRLKGGGGTAENDFVYFEGRIPDPQLWSPEHPNLYTVTATLGSDTATDRFGFRSFEARDGKLYLNGEPFYMIAALDQDFYPETIYTPPSPEYVRDMMMKAKRLGLNVLRCHIKVCDPTYLDAADETGMLVWYEVPSWNDFNHFSPKAAARGERVFTEMTARDWNRPSIVIQSIINEGWGTDLSKDAEQRRWLRAAYEGAKRLTAPLGRLIVDNSACCNNFHMKTDIEDNHRYNSMPDEHVPFDKWVAEFASRPKWNYSPFGDAAPTGREPLILSEFGNWGLPRLPRELPWWFGRDFGGRPVTRPAGLHERFREFQFDKLFGTYDALADATQWHQFDSLKHEIEEIRQHPSIQGYVITELTDINWEANGLMDMWRRPKVYAEELALIQQPDVILARLPKTNFAGGERVEIPVLFSSYETGDLNGSRVEWRLSTGDKGAFAPAQTGARATVSPVGKISLSLPQVTKVERVRLSLQVTNPSGQALARNNYDLFVYPLSVAGKETAIFFSAPPRTGEAAQRHEKFRAALARAGYTITDAAAGSGTAGARASALLIAYAYGPEVERHLRAGGRAIIIADAKEAFPDNANVKVVPRAGSDLDGNWVTNFNWVRNDAPPFRGLSLAKVLGFESAAVVPRHIIQGIDGRGYNDVLSGIFYGWLNNNAALAVQMRAGRGKLLATTFRFDEYGNDQFATHLFDAFVRHAASAGFNPQLDFNSAGATRAAHR